MKLKTYIVTRKNSKIIKINKEELIEELKTQIKPYIGKTYDNFDDAKADRVKLNKLITAIEERRKVIRQEFVAPYDNLVKEIKEIVAVIQEPLKKIKDQIKVFEDKRNVPKVQAIKDFYNEILDDKFKKLFPLTKIFNQKWLNFTYNLETIYGDIRFLKDSYDNSLFHTIVTISTTAKDYEKLIKVLNKNKFSYTVTVNLLKESTNGNKELTDGKDTEERNV